MKTESNVEPFMEKILNRKNHVYGLMMKDGKKVENNSGRIQELVKNTLKDYSYEEELSDLLIDDTKTQWFYLYDYSASFEKRKQKNFSW